jgi:hypothetical protein
VTILKSVNASTLIYTSCIVTISSLRGYFCTGGIFAHNFNRPGTLLVKGHQIKYTANPVLARPTRCRRCAASRLRARAHRGLCCEHIEDFKVVTVGTVPQKSPRSSASPGSCLQPLEAGSSRAPPPRRQRGLSGPAQQIILRRVAARTTKRRAGLPARQEASAAPRPALVAATPKASSRAPAKPAQHSMPREGTAAATAPVPSVGEDKESEMEVDESTRSPRRASWTTR